MPPPQSLLIQTSFLGDTVLATPLIAALASRGTVDVVVTPAAAPLLVNHPHIRELFTYDKRGADRGIDGVLRTARRIRARWRERGERAADTTAYLAQGSVRSAALARLTGAHHRVGFASAPGRVLYTHRVSPRTGTHHAARLLNLAFAQLGGLPPETDIVPRLYPGDAERDAVDRLLAPGPPPGGRPLVALAPGSIWGTKRWPYYADLAGRLTSRCEIVIVGGAADAAAAHAIVDAAPNSTLDATGRLSLLASAELIRRATVLVTNDSLPQHLASAMGTPTVTIFGPTVPEFGFGPLAPGSVSLGVTSLTCRPCHHHGPAVCPLGHWRCMRELGVDEVEAAVAAIMSRQRF
ncbi:MAG TPA: glycosyltransferase family 9 protein [Gemmatimonadaceae bacterium]|jgi:heptosyltransferase-2